MKKAFLILAGLAIVATLAAFGIALAIMATFEKEKNQSRTAPATAARQRMAEERLQRLEKKEEELLNQNEQANEKETQ